jgi:hypothetical protein
MMSSNEARGAPAGPSGMPRRAVRARPGATTPTSSTSLRGALALARRARRRQTRSARAARAAVPRAMPTAPAAMRRCSWAAAGGVGGGVAVAVGAELGVAVVLGGLAGPLCSGDAGFGLGVVMVGPVGVRSGGMETMVPRGAEMGYSVGVDVTASDIVNGLNVMTESDTATDVAIALVRIGGSGMTRVLVLVLWTAGTEEGAMVGGRVGVLVGCSAEPISALMD